jgi:hypothetical protein
MQLTPETLQESVRIRRRSPRGIGQEVLAIDPAETFVDKIRDDGPSD